MRPGAGLGDAWHWVNVFDDAAYGIENLLGISAPNGRGLAEMNTSAPRLVRPVEGDFAADAISLPAPQDSPTIGGILLWADADNYLRVERGFQGPHDVSFSGRIDAADTRFGRGRLAADRVHLRIERRGDTVRALCSGDGRDWSSIGEASFAVDGPMSVGMHALAGIDRTIYRGEHREGAAIRFESFTLRG